MAATITVAVSYTTPWGTTAFPVLLIVVPGRNEHMRCSPFLQ
jgi:hypothetical protein